MSRSADDLPEVTVALADPVEPQVAALKQRFPPGTEVFVRPADTPFRFRCRVHSSDVPVVFDTLVGLYHVPPVPLPDAPVIVDLGANIGCTMVHYASLYPGARIVGVELDADHARLAAINTANLPDALLLHAAIWGHDGTVEYGGDEAWGYKVADSGGRSVEALSMRTLLARHRLSRIDFLKVDIEGGERELFRGPLTRLGPVRALVIEVHDDELLIRELIELLRARKFQAQRDTATGRP